MATPRQLAANRRNAQKSTGPRSPEGKAASRFNALQHGIDAQSQCIPGENPEALATLAAEYHERFAPATPEERCLVDTLISCEWDLRRYRAASAQLWQMAAHVRCRPNESLPLADGFDFRDRTFNRLQRAIDSTHRNYLRALKTLQECQANREPEPAPDEPAQPEETETPTPKLASVRKPEPVLIGGPPAAPIRLREPDSKPGTQPSIP